MIRPLHARAATRTRLTPFAAILVFVNGIALLVVGFHVGQSALDSTAAAASAIVFVVFGAILAAVGALGRLPRE